MLTPLKAIRANCMDCMAGNAAEVARCPCENCPLFPYRFGHNPSRKGIGNKHLGYVETAVENLEDEEV